MRNSELLCMFSHRFFPSFSFFLLSLLLIHHSFVFQCISLAWIQQHLHAILFKLQPSCNSEMRAKWFFLLLLMFQSLLFSCCSLVFFSVNYYNFCSFLCLFLIANSLLFLSFCLLMFGYVFLLFLFSLTFDTRCDFSW